MTPPMIPLVYLTIPQGIFPSPIMEPHDLVASLRTCMIFAGVACIIRCDEATGVVSLSRREQEYEFRIHNASERTLILVAPKILLQDIATGLYFIALGTLLKRYQALCEKGKKPKRSKIKKVWVTFSEKEKEVKKLRYYKMIEG